MRGGGVGRGGGILLNVNPATKLSFFSRRQAHLEEKILLSTPGKGIFVDVTMNVVWLSGTSTCIFRSLPFFLSNLAILS
jgi:hypothetical protein